MCSIDVDFGVVGGTLPEALLDRTEISNRPRRSASTIADLNFFGCIFTEVSGLNQARDFFLLRTTTLFGSIQQTSALCCRVIAAFSAYTSMAHLTDSYWTQSCRCATVSRAFVLRRTRMCRTCLGHNHPVFCDCTTGTSPKWYGSRLEPVLWARAATAV